MSRPRKVSDDDVFAAAQRVMMRVGPADLTLATIAAEAGVTAGALVQRFGSKRDLLLALSAGASGATDAFMAELRGKHSSPLAAIRDYAACMAHLAESPAALTRSLAYLQIDLTDPGFRKHLLAQSRATRRWLEATIREAVGAGELTSGADPETLSRAVEAALSGALLTWAIYREGTAANWIRDIIDAVLAPHVTASGRSRARSAAQSKAQRRVRSRPK